jgi:hypothetical protein
VAYTILPAGFVALTPVRLFTQPRIDTLAVALSAAGGYAALALASFHFGMKRYRRGEVQAGMG